MMTEKRSAEKTVRDIRRRTRKKYSPEEKIRIVLEGLRGLGVRTNKPLFPRSDSTRLLSPLASSSASRTVEARTPASP